MRTIMIASVVVLLTFTSAAAQENRPVSYLAEFQLKPDNVADWIKLVRRDDEPMLNRLMGDGAVLTWGVGTAAASHPGRCPIKGEEGTTHLIWVVAADYAGMDKVFAGFNATWRQPPEDWP